MGSSPQHSDSNSGSPKTLKQRRAEDADRYRTQTISGVGLNLILPGSELGVPNVDQEIDSLPIGPMSPQA